MVNRPAAHALHAGTLATAAQARAEGVSFTSARVAWDIDLAKAREVLGCAVVRGDLAEGCCTCVVERKEGGA